MADQVELTIVVATLALCTIVGVYYIWVRKLGQSKETVAEQPSAGAAP